MFLGKVDAALAPKLFTHTHTICKRTHTILCVLCVKLKTISVHFLSVIKATQFIFLVFRFQNNRKFSEIY